tara:strand:- start:265 stop:597 length:333 start_codon:yes stop_codon:yes gene_type:complete
MKTKKILSNQIECLHCGDKPFSSHRHDFRSCECGRTAVDGGMEYLRRVGAIQAYKDMSIEWDQELFDSVSEAINWSLDNNRNVLGTICAIARYMRDTGYEVVPCSSTEER